MHSQVIVALDARQQFQQDLDAQDAMPSEAARRWLDEEFVRLECEPLRASGKLLLADKVLTVARAAAPDLLADPVWFAQFARAAHGALARPLIRVDLSTMAISY